MAHLAASKLCGNGGWEDNIFNVEARFEHSDS